MTRKYYQRCSVENNLHRGHIVHDEFNGEMICERCGVVLEQRMMVNESEEISPDEFYSEKNIGSSGIDLTKYTGILSTRIANGHSPFSIIDHTGNHIKGHTRDSLNRLYKTKQLQKINNNNDSSLSGVKKGLIRLDGLSRRLGLPDSAHQETARLYKKAHSQRLTKGRTISVIVAACTYCSCKILDIPRTISEIAIAANVSTKKIFAAYQVVVNSLQLFEKITESSSDDSMRSITQRRYIKQIPKIVSRLNLSQRITRKASDIILSQDDCVLAGKNPKTISAAAVYLACINNNNDHTRIISQRQIAEASNTTDVSIRKIARMMKKGKFLIFLAL